MFYLQKNAFVNRILLGFFLPHHHYFCLFFEEISLVRVLLVRVLCPLHFLRRSDNKHPMSSSITLYFVYWDVLNLLLNLELLIDWLSIHQEFPCLSLSRDEWYIHPTEREEGRVGGGLFFMGHGDWTQVLKLVGQALYPLSHFLNLVGKYLSTNYCLVGYEERFYADLFTHEVYSREVFSLNILRITWRLILFVYLFISAG